MDPTWINNLKRRYSYNTWRGVNRFNGDLLVWNLRFGGHEFPEWRLLKVRRYEGAGNIAMSETLWQRQFTPVVMSVNILETPSRARAHEALIEMLGRLELPVMNRAPEETTGGDVGFADRAAGVALFARGNLVVFVRNATPFVEPVLRLSRRVDEHLVSEPEPIGNADVNIRRVQSIDARRGREKRISFDVAGVDPPVALKAYTDAGRLSLANGRVVFRPDPGAVAALRLVAIDQLARANVRSVRPN